MPSETCPTADNRRYTIIDPSRGEPYCGIENVPANHANLMMLVPQVDHRHWTELKVHESTLTTAGVRVMRVEDA